MKRGLFLNLLIDIETKGNFDTELYNTIEAIPDYIIYNFEHELRKPRTIYDRARERVIKAFEELLKVIQIEKGTKFEKIQWDDIDFRHKELLDSIMAFVDDGFNIIKCLYKKSRGVGRQKSSVEWLKLVEPNLINECTKNVYSYRKRVGLIDNKIKHEHGKYQHLEFSFLYFKVYGYYIDSVDKDGVFQPNEDIHKKFNGMRTAISYNEDIRELLINYYLIAEQFSKTIKRIIKKEHDIMLNIEKCSYEQNDRILKLINNINGLQEAFFIDEYMNLPQIIILKNKIQLRQKAYSSYIDKLLKPTRYRIVTENRLEDKCIIALPYMELKKNNK